MMHKAMRKCGNATLDACDKADDAKHIFPNGSHNQQIVIFQRICNVSGAIHGAKVQIGSTGGPKKHIFQDIAAVRLQDDIMTACIVKSSPEMVLMCLNVGLRRNVLHQPAPLQL